MRGFHIACAAVTLATAACDDVAPPQSAFAHVVTNADIIGEDTTGDHGPIRLTYLCGTTFRIRNFGTDTTTVTWDVKKTDEQGTILLRSRGTAAHSDTTFTTQHTGTVRLYRDGVLLQSKGKVFKACVTKPKLTVIVEHGVIESHALHDDDYQIGDEVNYDFKSKSGFTNVLVTLDGTYVPASGTVTMDGDHVLIVSADSVVNLTPQEQQLATAIRKVITSADPVAAYRTLITTLAGVTDRANLDNMIRRAAYVAYDPLTDSAALRRADDALANHVFTLDLSGGPAKVAVTDVQVRSGMHTTQPIVITAPRRSIDIPTGAPRDSLEPTTYLYVNGIFTTPEKCAQTLLRLRTLLRQVPRLNHPEFAVAQFYNRSMWHQVETPEQRRASCIASLETRLPFLGSRSWGRFLERCYGEHSTIMPTDNDISEAVTQYVRIQLKLQPSTPDAEILADSLHEIRTRGRHIIMIPHSQGNLMVIQAVNTLRSTFQYDETRDSIGLAVVPLASPTSNGWNFPSGRVKPITVLGDIVPDLGLSSWPRTPTPASTSTATEITKLTARASNSPIVLAYVALRQIMNGVALHNVDETYLQGDVALAVRDSAASAYQEVAVGELNIGLTQDQIPVGQGRNLPLYTSIFNQHELGNRNTIPLRGRDIAWRSMDPSIVTVSPQGQVTAKTPGTTTVWARSWTDSALVRFTVVAVPDILSGTYTGTWETLDYSLPYMKESATMTLQASGSTVTGVVTWSSGGSTYSSSILSGYLDPMGTTLHFTLQPPDPEAVALGKRCIGSTDIEAPDGNTNTGAGAVDCYQVISLHLSGTQLMGTSYGVGPVWSRIWTLQRSTTTTH